MYRPELTPRLPSSRQRGELMGRTSVVEGGGEAKTRRAACKRLVYNKIKTRRAALIPGLTKSRLSLSRLGLLRTLIHFLAC